jgi:hypothetical protein
MCYLYWIIIDDEDVFKGPNEDNWGYADFVHHDMLYSPNNQFVKNDVIFLCASIIRGDVLPKQLTKFHRNILSSYKEGLTGECTLVVSGKEFKVKIKLFKVLLVILDFQNSFDSPFQSIQSDVYSRY